MHKEDDLSKCYIALRLYSFPILFYQVGNQLLQVFGLEVVANVHLLLRSFVSIPMIST